MADLIGLSRADVDLLREMAKEFRARRANPEAGRGEPEKLSYAPEVYLALTPAGGIPGRGLGPDTGTGTSTGSGSGTDRKPGGNEDDLFGSAVCQLYKLRDFGKATRSPTSVQGLRERVFNMEERRIKGWEWVLAVRDKLGTWWALGGPGDDDSAGETGTGSPFTGTGTGTGSDDVPPDCIAVLVDARCVDGRLVLTYGYAAACPN